MKPASLKHILTALIVSCAFLSNNAPLVQAQSDRITFTVIGDYGLAGQPLLDVSNLIKSWNPDFIVTLGDNNYPNGQSSTIDDNIGQYFQEYIFQYKGKYGSGSPVRRFYPSLGNHDWSSTDAKPYLDYFGIQRYYDFVQGPVHFFILDSDRNEPDGVTSDSQQAIWLRKGLAASASPFNVVVFHHAPYSSGQHGPTEYMRWPFKDWGADVVLSGHDHIYERLSVNGLPYFVNGIGGGELYDIRNILPESQVRFNQDFGAMRVEATSVYMKLQMFTRAGILVDEYIVGEKAPLVTSITRLDPSPTNLGSIDYQVIFSENVTGVDVSDFALTTDLSNASITGINGSGNLYIVSVNTGSGDGTLRLDLLDNDSIVNASGIPLGWVDIGNANFTSSESYSIDKTVPFITSITLANPNPTNASTVDFIVTFSESITGVDLSDFTLITNNSAILAGISGSGMSYTVSVTNGNGNDNLRLDFVDNDSVTDSAGNFTDAGFSNGQSYSVDRAAPIVTSITPMGQPDASGVDFTVSFSEAVTGVDGGDFFLSTLNGAAITNISGAGSQYVVSVSTQPGSDSIRLDVIDNDNILDSIGNTLGGSGMSNGNFMGGIFNIAIEAPIATSIIRTRAEYTNASVVEFILTFSEPVTGVDTADFTLTNGAVISNIKDLSPFYILTVTASTTDGEIKLDLIDDDSIRNQQGIPLGGNGAGNANFATGERYIIDRMPPQVTSIIRASGNPAINSTADFIVTFSEPINGVEISDFVITQSNIIQSTVVNFQDANPFYWVTVSTGAGSGTIRLDLFDNGNITDRAGNKLINNPFINGESFNLAKIPVDFPAPNINTLSNSLTNNIFEPLSWSTVRNAGAYEVFIARDSGFSKLVFAQTTAASTLIPLTPLTDGIYYMRVRAYTSDFNPGKFSKTYTFTVDSTPPPPPTLRSPANRSTTPKRPWLAWWAVSGATKYQLEIDNNADFSSPEFSAITNKTTLQVKTLLARQYYWQVRAMDSAGNWSVWSSAFTFTTR